MKALFFAAIAALLMCLLWNYHLMHAFRNRQPALFIDGVTLYAAIVVSLLYLKDPRR